MSCRSSRSTASSRIGSACSIASSQQQGEQRIGVVGAGAGGVEILLAVQYRLRQLLLERGRTDDHIGYRLFSAADDILPSHNPRTRRIFERVLRDRQVQVVAGTPVVEVAPGRIATAQGTHYALDEILWVTAAGAAPWLAEAGLQVDAQGFVAVNDTLQSASHPSVFAAGDIASVLRHPRPKSGVFAVRQGKPLAGNLRRALLGRELVPFRPQRKFLSLIATGDKYAVASRGNWALQGRLMWRWKDSIDRRFMQQYSLLPEMAAARISRSRNRSRRRRGHRRTFQHCHALRRLRREGRQHGARPGARPTASDSRGRIS